ncbi:hypothetical protein IW261DRAFT_1424270 [Armillaria novae-zelandiae]|uniref:Uncharacterized protein n=1 Tax=Armillaria novae-zelandiae TaxID=153914 RepID=A0AA39UBC4_9AGAR|nr:hypothetical protein IW261DRAFT_1424270 [Armillaria novae-zelandiae]
MTPMVYLVWPQRMARHVRAADPAVPYWDLAPVSPLPPPPLPRTPEAASSTFQPNNENHTSSPLSRHDHPNYAHHYTEFNASISDNTELLHGHILLFPPMAGPQPSTIVRVRREKGRKTYSQENHTATSPKEVVNTACTKVPDVPASHYLVLCKLSFSLSALNLKMPVAATNSDDNLQARSASSRLEQYQEACLEMKSFIGNTLGQHGTEKMAEDAVDTYLYAVAKIKVGLIAFMPVIINVYASGFTNESLNP